MEVLSPVLVQMGIVAPLWGGIIIVNGPLGSLNLTIGGRGRGCLGLVRIIVLYTLLYSMVEIGGLSLTIGLLGPPPQYGGLSWLFHVDCNILFGDSSPSPCTPPRLCCIIRRGHNNNG